jgi:ribosomal protein S18 acetylase RimI-like enzyme
MIMEIRKAKKDEWKKLQALNEEAFQDNDKYDSDLVDDWAYTKQGEKYFRSIVSDPKKLCLVAEIDSELIGYLAASSMKLDYSKLKYLEIENIGVGKEYRSTGIGQKLMSESLLWAKQNGFQKVCVNSYSKNVGAVKFYEKCGFEIIDVGLEIRV